MKTYEERAKEILNRLAMDWAHRSNEEGQGVRHTCLFPLRLLPASAHPVDQAFAELKKLNKEFGFEAKEKENE